MTVFSLWIRSSPSPVPLALVGAMTSARKQLTTAEVSQTLSAVGAPSMPSNANKEAVGKLGQRVAQHIVEYRETEELVTLDPDEVGVARANRKETPPNLKVLHKKLTNSLSKDFYDPNRHLALRWW